MSQKQRLPFDEWVLPGVPYRSLGGDIATAAMLIVTGLLFTRIGVISPPDPDRPLGSWAALWASVIVVAAVSLFKRRMPITAVAVAGAVFVASPLLIAQGLPLVPLIALVDALYAAMLYATPRRRRVVYALAAAVSVFILVLSLPLHGTELIALVIGAVAIAGMPIAWGTAVRQRDELLSAERARTDAIERAAEAERTAAVRAERNEVAGELHDEIAARLSAISLQASALRGDADPRRSAAIESMRTSSREALDELHRLIGMLAQDRNDEGRPSDAAQIESTDPRDAIRAQADAFGTTLRIEGTPGPLAPPLAHTVERIGREAIANAAKHAPGAPVDVAFGRETGAVTISIENPLPAPGASPAPIGSGLGTDLMTARWRAMGGSGSIGAADDRWRVEARIPIAPGSIPDAEPGPPSGDGAVASAAPASPEKETT